MRIFLLALLLATTASDASILFSQAADTAENDRVQVIDQAIITTTEGLVHCDGVKL